MNKKLMLMVLAAGVLSLSASFGVSWFMGKKAAAAKAAAIAEARAKAEQTAKDAAAKEAFDSIESKPGVSGEVDRIQLTERQLKGLVYDLQQKIQEYNNKLKSLESREMRMQVAQENLKKDIEELGNLQVELASTVNAVKEQRDKLLKSRIEIEAKEKANLASIAATYDKMDSTSAGKILVGMSKVPGTSNMNSLEDAVKILYFMNERTKAKVLAELVTSEPTLAAVLCQKMKQVSEKE